MPSTDLESRLDAIESQLAVEKLIYHYAHAFDRRDPELLRDIWHHDAVYDLGPAFGSFRGVDDIVAGAHDLWAQIPHMHHWMATVVIEVTGDIATADSSLDSFVVTSETGPTQVGGRYLDVFERRDGRWAFTSRTFELHYWTPIPGWNAVMGSEAPAPAES